MTGPARRADLGIGNLTVRGRGLSADAGRNLASAVAAALSEQLPPGSARMERMTIRLPASVVDAGGRIDRATLFSALARAGRNGDA